MKPTLLVAALAVLGSSAVAQQPGEPLALPIHPHYRTEVVFPAAIVRVSGTAIKGGFTFKHRGNVLSIRPVAWPQGDPRYDVRTVVHVFTGNRGWQLDLNYDFTLTDHLRYVGFENTGTEAAAGTQPAPPATALDRLFLRFITAGGRLPFLPQRSSDELYPTPVGTVRVLRTFPFREHTFIYAELVELKTKLPLGPEQMQSLALFPERLGQLFTPASSQRSDEPIPLFYLYAARRAP